MEGNQQKMREALVKISKIADDWSLYANTKAGALDRIYELANSALSEPPRNCDRAECGDFHSASDVFDRLPSSGRLWGEDYFCELGKWLYEVKKKLT